MSSNFLLVICVLGHGKVGMNECRATQVVREGLCEALKRWDGKCQCQIDRSPFGNESRPDCSSFSWVVENVIIPSFLFFFF